MKNILNKISFGIILFTFLCLLVAIFWLVCPYKTLELNSPITVVEKQIVNGQELHYIIDFCKYVKTVTVNRQFIDEIIYASEPVEVSMDTGCYKSIHAIRIPLGLHADTYILRITATIKVNPLRTITKVFDTDKFEVIKK